MLPPATSLAPGASGGPGPLACALRCGTCLSHCSSGRGSPTAECSRLLPPEQSLLWPPPPPPPIRAASAELEEKRSLCPRRPGVEWLPTAPATRLRCLKAQEAPPAGRRVGPGFELQSQSCPAAHWPSQRSDTTARAGPGHRAVLTPHGRPRLGLSEREPGASCTLVWTTPCSEDHETPLWHMGGSAPGAGPGAGAPSLRTARVGFAPILPRDRLYWQILRADKTLAGTIKLDKTFFFLHNSFTR